MKPTCLKPKALPHFFESHRVTPQGGLEKQPNATLPAGRVWRWAAIFLTPLLLAQCAINGQIEYQHDGKSVTLSNRGLGIGVQRDDVRADVLFSLPKRSEGFSK